MKNLTPADLERVQLDTELIASIGNVLRSQVTDPLCQTDGGPRQKLHAIALEAAERVNATMRITDHETAKVEQTPAN